MATTWDRIVESEMRDILQKAFLRYKGELERIEEMLPVEESELYRLLFQVKLESVKEIDSFRYSSEKCKFLRDLFQQKSKSLEEDLLDLNNRKSKEICEALEKQLLKELVLKFELLKHEPLPPGFGLTMMDHIRSQYLGAAVGSYKYDVFITSILNQFTLLLDQAYQGKQGQLRAELNELRVHHSSLEGRYEASQMLLEQMKQMRDTMEAQRSARQSDEARTVINRDAINMAEVKRTNDNFNHLMQEFKRTTQETFEEKARIIEEREALKFERMLQTEMDRLRREHLAETEERKRRAEKDVNIYKEEIKRLEILRQENLAIILQKEAEVRFLQEKIKHDERMKQTQIEHGKMLSSITDQIVVMLEKYEEKTQGRR